MLTGVSTRLPEFLLKYDIELSKEKTLLIRITVPLLILWIGTFIILILIVRYLKTLNSHPNIFQDPTPEPKLSKPTLEILIFFGRQNDVPLTTQQLSEIFKTTYNQTQLAIDELLHCDFLYTEVEWVEDQKCEWGSDQGNYLI